MQQEQHFFAAGLNTDADAPSRTPADYLAAVNVLLEGFRGENRGALHALPGNTSLLPVTTLLNALGTGPYTCLGHTTNEATGKITLFLHGQVLYGSIPGEVTDPIYEVFNPVEAYRDDRPGGIIIEVDPVAGTAYLKLHEWWVVGGFGWLATDYISAAQQGELIVFTNGRGDVRYLDRAGGYSVGNISQSELSLICEPPALPLTVSRANNSSVGPNALQRMAVQCTARFVLRDGTYSVLAPYSRSLQPVSGEDLSAIPYAGNEIQMALPLTVKIPRTWARVDFVVRDVVSDTHTVVRSFDFANSADTASVAAHNNGADALDYSWTSPSGGEVLDTAYVSKTFDAMPRDVTAVTAVSNRLGLFGFAEGRTTPVAPPARNVTPVVSSVAAPSAIILDSGGSNRAEIWMGFTDDNEWYYAYVFVIGGVHHVIAEHPFRGVFEDDTTPSGGGFPYTVYGGDDVGGTYRHTQIPRVVSKSALVPVPGTYVLPAANIQGSPWFGSMGSGAIYAEHFHAVIRKAHGRNNIEFDGSAVFWFFPLPDGYVVVENDIPYSLATHRAMIPGATYRWGWQYFGTGRRKSGALPDSTFTIPGLNMALAAHGGFAAVNGSVTERIDIAPNPGIIAAVPSWATHWSPVMSENNKAQTYLAGVAGLVVWVFKENGAYNIYGETLTGVGRAFGIGIPLTNLDDEGLGYTPKLGDFCDLCIADGYIQGAPTLVNMTLRVDGMSGGHVILTGFTPAQRDVLERNISTTSYTFIIQADPAKAVPNNSPTRYRQTKIVYALYTPKQTIGELYEVGHTGIVEQATGGGAYLRSSSGTSSNAFALYGDTYTAKRSSVAGTAYLPATTTNENVGTLDAWVGDRGRIAPLDSVGSKRLGSSFRWSNAAIPGGRQTGLASFDALDIYTLDAKTGDITTAMGLADGSGGASILILTTAGTYVALVEKNVLTSPDGSGQLAQSSRFIGSVGADPGGWGCQSPRSLVLGKSGPLWVDALRREVLRYAGRVEPVSRKGAVALWQEALGTLDSDFKRRSICAGYHAGYGVFFVTIPAASNATPAVLPTTTTPYPFRQMGFAGSSTYLFDERIDAWISRVDGVPTLYMPLRGDLFSWFGNKLWKEASVAAFTTYYGVNLKASVGIAFSAGYPAIKTAATLIVDSDVAPESDYVLIEYGTVKQLSRVQKWQNRNGKWYGPIMRDRLGANAVTVGDGDTQQFRGGRLKGQTAKVWLQFPAGPVRCTSVTLVWDAANGH